MGHLGLAGGKSFRRHQLDLESHMSKTARVSSRARALHQQEGLFYVKKWWFRARCAHWSCWSLEAGALFPNTSMDRGPAKSKRLEPLTFRAKTFFTHFYPQRDSNLHECQNLRNATAHEHRVRHMGASGFSSTPCATSTKKTFFVPSGSCCGHAFRPRLPTTLSFG